MRRKQWMTRWSIASRWRVPREAYPLRVALELTYRLEEDGLRVEFSFMNEEPDLDAHVSFGLHPGFAVSSVKNCRVLLPEGTYVRYHAPGNFLDGREEEVPFAGGEMPFDKAKLPDSYLLGLERVPKRFFALEDAALGRRIDFDFAAVPFLTLWADQDTYICIEPCWGLPITIRQAVRTQDRIRSSRLAPPCGAARDPPGFLS